MLYSPSGMPTVFVLGRDWTLRAGVRAELREAGIEAVGMESVEDAATLIAAGTRPSVIVFDAGEGEAPGPELERVAGGARIVVVASRTRTVAPLPAAAMVLYRPVRIGEIVAHVVKLLQGEPS